MCSRRRTHSDAGMLRRTTQGDVIRKKKHKKNNKKALVQHPIIKGLEYPLAMSSFFRGSL